jgi:hypothetical protein
MLINSIVLILSPDLQEESKEYILKFLPMKPSCTISHNKKMQIMKLVPMNRDKLCEQLNLQ